MLYNGANVFKIDWTIFVSIIGSSYAMGGLSSMLAIVLKNCDINKNSINLKLFTLHNFVILEKTSLIVNNIILMFICIAFIIYVVVTY